MFGLIKKKGKSPYKSVCTHGWVVDGEGRKMSKSLANGVKPEKILSKYGADILRLWVASSDYHSDIRISEDILKQLTESYRKIRNTARFILGNLCDFNPDLDMLEIKDLEEIDIFAITKLNELIKTVKNAYDEFKFFNIFHNLHNFCVVHMSNFYLDIIKDRLYCEKANGKTRRAAQTTMYIILDALTRMIAPILAYTSEEIWSYLPHKKTDVEESILFNEMYDEIDVKKDKEFTEKWSKILKVREFVQKALEEKRRDKHIGSSLEAKVLIYCEDEMFNFLDSLKDILKTIFIVSKVEVLKGTDGEYKFEEYKIGVDIKKPDGEKCERCWSYCETVGKNPTHKTLCERCCEVLN